MEHAVDDSAQLHDPSRLKSVLVTCWRLSSPIDETDVQQYMATREQSGGGSVERVYKPCRFTYVVDLHNPADAVNVVRRDQHWIEGWPVCVFLYDEDRKTVYSGHQTVSCQDGGRKQVVDIPRVDPRAPTTVIVTGVPYGWGATADDIKVRMETLGNVGCRVKSVQCLEPVYIAIVEFERSEDAMRVGNMERVTVPVWVEELSVCVFVLRPLPSDPADIPNTAHTAIPGIPASAARVGQTQALERNQAPGAPVTPPHDSRTMQDGVTSETSRAEGTFQKEKSLVQNQTEELRRMKDQVEELRRARDQLEALVKAQVEDKARMQSDIARLEARLQKVNAEMTQLRAGLQTHQRQCQATHTQRDAHQRQYQEQNEVHGRLTSRIAADTQNSLVRNTAAEIGTMRGQLHTVSQQVQALQGQLARLPRQGEGHGVAQVRGPGLEVTNPSDSDED